MRIVVSISGVYVGVRLFTETTTTLDNLKILHDLRPGDHAMLPQFPRNKVLLAHAGFWCVLLIPAAEAY